MVLLGCLIRPRYNLADEYTLDILAAHNDARNKLEATIAEKTQALTAGLPLPPGMKLPF